MREWFILFLLYSFLSSGSILFKTQDLRPKDSTVGTADHVLTVPIGGSGTGQGTGSED
ncbi:MAG: hypothetical protein ABR524_01205 [Thermoanaerobaculia bacterium]